MLCHTGHNGWRLVVSLMTLGVVASMPSTTAISSSSSSSSMETTTTTTTARANVSPIGETIKQLAGQLMNLNTTSELTFDTRTPPKFREQTRKDHHPHHHQADIIEFGGHPGVAEAVDDEALLLEQDAQKKLNFYHVDKSSTTDSGLSTWILLSGQSSTSKPTKKPPPTTTKNTTNEEKPIKPIFKRKSTTSTTTPSSSSSTIEVAATKRPSTHLLSTTLKATIATTSTSTSAEKSSAKITKVKPTKKVTTSSSATATKPAKSTTVEQSSTTTASVATTKKSTTEYVKVPTKLPELQPEAKEGALDLTADNTKKTKRPVSSATPPTANNKRKKNKTRRKKPTTNNGHAEDKLDLSAANSTSTKVAATKLKEKPIGTQIYNYLSREVMPTVGVGLVGLMVTAGLASYFLYPFGGVLRRSYDIQDRKDKEGGAYLHYADEYGGGIAEEDAIGKVIAGMPTSSYYSRNTPYGGYHQPAGNTRFRNVDQRYMEGTVEPVALNPLTAYRTEEVIVGSPKKQQHAYSNHKEAYEEPPVTDDDAPPQPEMLHATTAEPMAPIVVPEHGPRTIEQQQQQVGARDHEKVFVVESIPAHAEALYAVEHGPRRRRRRNVPKDSENEIDVGDKKIKYTTTTTEEPPTTTEENYYYYTTTMNPILEKTESILGLIKDLIYLKVRLGLQLLQDKAQSLSRYFRTVQERIDVTYKNVNQTTSPISYN